MRLHEGPLAFGPDGAGGEDLGGIPGVTLHVLQQGAARRAWPAGEGVLSDAERIEELASIMRSLDLVISVDSFG